MKHADEISIASGLVLTASRDARAARVAEGEAQRRFANRQISLGQLIAAVRASALADSRVEQLTLTMAVLKGPQR